jgi:hypothetical protein
VLKDIEIGNVAEIGPVGHPPASKYERLIADAKRVRAPPTVVVHPCEETALRGPPMDLWRSTMPSIPKRHGSRASSRRLPGARRFWWCRISRPAICLPRTLPSWPRRTQQASFLAHEYPSSSPRGRILCVRAWLPARRPSSTPMHAGALWHCPKPDRYGCDPRR